MDGFRTRYRTLERVSRDTVHRTVNEIRRIAFWTGSLLAFVWVGLLLVWEHLPIEISGGFIILHIVALLLGHSHKQPIDEEPVSRRG